MLAPRQRLPRAVRLRSSGGPRATPLRRPDTDCAKPRSPSDSRAAPAHPPAALSPPCILRRRTRRGTLSRRPSGTRPAQTPAWHGRASGQAPCELHIAASDLLRRQGVQVGWVAVEEAQVALIDRSHVVAHGPVVTATRPCPGEARRQSHLSGDLGRRVAAVGQAQRLVVQVAIEVAVARRGTPICAHAPSAANGAGRTSHPSPRPNKLDRLAEVLRPAQRVAHQRAARRQHVVHTVSGVLRDAETSGDLGSGSSSRPAPRFRGPAERRSERRRCRSSCPVAETSWVGGISVIVPLEVVLPIPASTWPRGPRPVAARTCTRRGAASPCPPARSR